MKSEANLSGKVDKSSSYSARVTQRGVVTARDLHWFDAQPVAYLATHERRREEQIVTAQNPQGWHARMLSRLGV